MPYMQCNWRICKALGAQQRRSPLLRYALDTEYLPDDLYASFPLAMREQFGNDGDGFLRYLQRLSYFVALFAIRAFFEEGDGLKYRETFRSRFPPKLRSHLEGAALTTLFDCLFNDLRFMRFMGGSRPRSRFLGECWVLGHPTAGETSEVWKTLVPMVREIREDNPTLDDALKVASDFAANNWVPEYYHRLIADEEPAFLESLIALRTGHGQEWLSRIAPLWTQKNTEPSATTGWKLYVNGNVRELRLVVDHIFVPNVANGVNLIVSQQKNQIERVWQGGATAEFRVEEFQRCGFDLSRSINVRISRFHNLVHGLALDRRIFFRYPVGRRTGWMPTIEEGQHVFATGIVILWPPGVEQAQPLQLGTAALSMRVLGNVKVPCSSPEQSRLAQTVEFIGLSEPQSLIWNSQPLLQIGSKPYLDVREDDLRCPQQPNWLFVLGSEAQVTLRNHPAQEPTPQWRCDGNVDGSGATVTIRPAELGKPVRISCGKARTELVFIPPQSLDNQLPGWRWQPCTAPADVARFARDGLVVGTLSGPNQVCLRLTRNRGEIIWWWERGIVGMPEGVNTRKDFYDHGELGPYMLCVWVPEGQTAGILFNEGPVGRPLTGPIFDSFLIRELLPHLDFAGDYEAPVDQLVLRPDNGPEAPLADIMRVPAARPWFGVGPCRECTSRKVRPQPDTPLPVSSSRGLSTTNYR